MMGLLLIWGVGEQKCSCFCRCSQ